MFGHSPKLTHATAYEGISPAGFLQAAREGNFEIVLKYIQQGSDVCGNLDVRDRKGNTAAMIAAEKGFLKTLNILIDHRANLNLLDEVGDTALHKAIKSGKQDVVHALAAAGDINLEVKRERTWYSDAGKTALRLALEEGHAEIVEILISHGARIDNYYELVSIAQKHNHSQVIKYLSENKDGLLEIAKRQNEEDCSASDSDEEQYTSNMYFM